MDIIPRADWGARHPDGFRNAPLPAREIWLHHSVTPAPHGGFDDDAAAVRSLEHIGQDRFGGGISYTFVVPPSGRVFAGHSVHRQGAHTGGRNDISRAICLVGNYEVDHVTDDQLDAVAALLRHGAAEGWWTAPRLTGGHRDLKATACPGRHAYARIDDINRRAASGGGAAAPGGDDDMTPEQARQLDAVHSMLAYGSTIRGREFPGLLPIAAETQRRVTAARAEAAGLAEALRTLASDLDVDPDAIAAAAEAGTRRALAEGTVDVDVTVSGGGTDE